MTYLHESGLWYLALSLAQELKKQGKNVYFIPKIKYVKVGNRYQKQYLDGRLEHQELILPLNLKESLSAQINKYISFYQIDVLVSFETLLEDGKWLKEINTKIIDIPMLEWVTPKYLYNSGYQVFDEIWALTKITYQTFNQYYQVERVKWDFVDRNIFYQKNNSKKPGFTFFHQASLNPDHTTKNTELVIQAFLNFSENDNLRLLISGNLKQSLLKEISKSNKIKYFDKLLSRQEVASIYNTADCVVAPSSKEGLGLTLFEAKACGCQIITTDVSPMNECSTNYLCQVAELELDNTLVPVAKVTFQEIYHQMNKAYKDKK